MTKLGLAHVLYLALGSLLLLWAGLGLAEAGPKEVVYVQGGVAKSTREPGEKWTRGEGYLENTGKPNFLFATDDLGNGDVVVDARLALVNVEGTAASFKMGPDWFGFDGKGNTLFVNGFGLGVKILEPNESWFRPGRPFDFRMVRKRSQVSIFINGKKAFATQVSGKPREGEFGFQPNRTKLRVYSFSARGSLVARKPPPAIADRGLPEDIENDRAERAIDSGIEWLLEEIRKERVGIVESHAKYAPGQVALETYALIVAGVSVDQPEIRDNFAYMKNHIFKKSFTYDVACYVFALDAAIAQLEYDDLLVSPARFSTGRLDNPKLGRPYRRELEKAVGVLLSGQNATGGWRYTPQSRDVDNSCTQFAALALGIGAKRNISVAQKVWLDLGRYLIGCQQSEGPLTPKRITLRAEKAGGSRDDVEIVDGSGQNAGTSRKKDGEKRDRTRVGTPRDPVVGTEKLDVRARGWKYREGKKTFEWSMACAGVSSLLVVYDRGYRGFSWEEREELRQAIRDGYGWLLENWKSTSSYYGMYSLEKVADIGRVERFADVDWYDELSSHLLDAQRRDGSWPTGAYAWEAPRVSSSLALLILRRATSLLAMNPAEQVIVTGVEGMDTQTMDPGWVYVPDYDSYLYAPDILRSVRRRPKIKLLELVEKICTHMPAEHRPDLLIPLAHVMDRVGSKGARRVVTDGIEVITGEKLATLEAVRAWKTRWDAIDSLSAAEADTAGKLADFYRNASGIVLRRAAARGLIRHQERQAIPLFLDDLDDRGVEVRELAYRSLTRFYPSSFPEFDAAAKARLRERQVAAIRSFVERTR